MISDGGVWSGFTTTLNGRLGYVFESGIKLNLDAFNLLNTQAPPKRRAALAHDKIGAGKLSDPSGSVRPPPVAKNAIMQPVER